MFVQYIQGSRTLPVKINIQVVYVSVRITVSGILKDFVKKETDN